MPVNNGLTETSIRALAVSGISLFAATYSGGVFRSENQGARWIAVNDGLSQKDVPSLAVAGTNLFAGTGGAGVWRYPLE
jgi:hypothetical protein